MRVVRAASACLLLLGAVLLAACETVDAPQPAPPVAAAPPAPEPAPFPAVEGAPVDIERLPAPVAPGLMPPGAVEPVKVALLLPLSGPQAGLGRALLDAALLALFEAGDERLTLLPKDTGASAQTAQLAAEQALAEGAALILGPVFRDAAAAVGPAAAARGVNVVTFSTDTSVAGGNVFLFGFTPEQQVDRVVKYATARGLLRFAALTPANAYGVAVGRALRDAAAAAGAEVVRLETYSGDGRDADAAVQRLASFEARKAALAERRRALAGSAAAAAQRELAALANREALNEYDFDAVLLPEGGQALRNLAPLLAYYEIDVNRIRVLGTSQWDDPALLREPALRGGWFAAPSPAAAQEFARRFEQAYGRRPSHLGSLAYDAVALAAALARGGGFGAEALRSPNGFVGVDGIFRFRPDNVAERGLAVLEVQPDGFRPVSEAPRTFEERAF